MSARPVLIMAGGTGGHVYPALAVARALERAACPVVWLGTRSGLEARVVPAAGIDMEWLTIRGLRGNGVIGWLLAPFRLARALAEALAVVRRRNPAAVLGMGGFASGPGGIAAWLARRPLLIHEQNAVAGLTNRLLARFARVVLCAFPGSFLANVRAELVGNPVRETIARIAPPAERFAARTGPLRVLVLGGSLGAASLNDNVPATLARLAETVPLVVRHQCGRGRAGTVTEAYRQSGIDAEASDYIEAMDEAYAWADAAICRGGALTLAELAAAGLGAVIVPYPHAVDDHQTANAAEYVAAGAGLIVADQALPDGALDAALSDLGQDRERLQKRAEAARRVARPDALAVITTHCLTLAGAAHD